MGAGGTRVDMSSRHRQARADDGDGEPLEVPTPYPVAPQGYASPAVPFGAGGSRLSRSGEGRPRAATIPFPGPPAASPGGYRYVKKAAHIGGWSMNKLKSIISGLTARVVKAFKAILAVRVPRKAWAGIGMAAVGLVAIGCWVNQQTERAPTPVTQAPYFKARPVRAWVAKTTGIGRPEVKEGPLGLYRRAEMPDGSVAYETAGSGWTQVRYECRR